MTLPAASVDARRVALPYIQAHMTGASAPFMEACHAGVAIETNGPVKVRLGVVLGLDDDVYSAFQRFNFEATAPEILQSLVASWLEALGQRHRISLVDYSDAEILQLVDHVRDALNVLPVIQDLPWPITVSFIAETQTDSKPVHVFALTSEPQP